MDVVLGIRSRGPMTVGADDYTEQWQPPNALKLSIGATAD